VEASNSASKRAVADSSRPEFGVHLPLIDFEGVGWSNADLVTFARTADQLGYTFICANDHLVYDRPWLDCTTALASVIEASGQTTLATTVVLPVVRGPVQTAKTLAAIDVLSGGRLVIGVGPGSSARDYAVVGLDFEDRWKRLEEAIRSLRALLRTDTEAFSGAFYSSEGTVLEPHPVQVPGPPIWVGSWGSEAGMRRVARLGDGWLASGYNTTPGRFEEGRAYLAEQLEARGKSPDEFPNAIATVWTYVTEDRREAERILRDVLSPMLRRPVEALRELSLPIGPAETCVERLAAFAQAGVQRMFLWPLAHPLRQLEVFQDRVAPLVRRSM
jgi:alkanesulfonate monooxygenase SsuD/methylene tetrahydromethanopterin reductase-like flavin-dependent oxidoreductase (luciferase family)